MEHNYVKYQDHRYVVRGIIKETNGVDVQITEIQTCLKSSDKCVTETLENIVEIEANRWVATFIKIDSTINNDKVEITYSGKDVNGHSVTVKSSLTLIIEQVDDGGGNGSGGNGGGDNGGGGNGGGGSSSD